MAFEAAQQLTALGVNVKGLVLIDSPSPLKHEPLPAAIISGITKSIGQLEHLSSASRFRLEEEFLSNASLLGIYEPESFPQATGSRLKTIMLRSQETLDTESLWHVRYDWLSRQDTRDAAVFAWQKLVGGHVEVLPIPGNHFESFLKDKVSVSVAFLPLPCLSSLEQRTDQGRIGC